MFFFCGDAGNRFRACIRGILFPSFISLVLLRVGCKKMVLFPNLSPDWFIRVLFNQQNHMREKRSRVGKPYPRADLWRRAGGKGRFFPRICSPFKSSAAVSSAASTATGRAVGESCERNIGIVIGIDHKRLLLCLIAVLIR